MRKLLFSVLIVIFLSCSAWAAKSVGYEELAAGTGAAVSLSSGTIKDNAGAAKTLTQLSAAYPDLWATVQVADYPIAWLTSGTPTASTKKTGSVGDTVWLESYSDLVAFKAIGVGGTANLAITFYSGSAR